MILEARKFCIITSVLSVIILLTSLVSQARHFSYNRHVGYTVNRSPHCPPLSIQLSENQQGPSPTLDKNSPLSSTANAMPRFSHLHTSLRLWSRSFFTVLVVLPWGRRRSGPFQQRRGSHPCRCLTNVQQQRHFPVRRGF